MRSRGTHRGNPILRASVEQSSRRRLESLLVPHSGLDEFAADPLHAPEPTSSRAFFDRVREHVLPQMAPALDVDGTEVRYFGTDGLGLWGMQAAQGLVLAYECADTPALLVERARRWLSCLRTRTTPGILDRTWGRPVYGARLDAACDALEVVWATPGDWCRFVLSDAPVVRRWSQPPHWRTRELAGT
jgi:hypothetical protein